MSAEQPEHHNQIMQNKGEEEDQEKDTVVTKSEESVHNELQNEQSEEMEVEENFPATQKIEEVTGIFQNEAEADLDEVNNKVKKPATEENRETNVNRLNNTEIYLAENEEDEPTSKRQRLIHDHDFNSKKLVFLKGNPSSSIKRKRSVKEDFINYELAKQFNQDLIEDEDVTYDEKKDILKHIQQIKNKKTVVNNKQQQKEQLGDIFFNYFSKNIQSLNYRQCEILEKRGVCKSWKTAVEEKMEVFAPLQLEQSKIDRFADKLININTIDFSHVQKMDLNQDFIINNIEDKILYTVQQFSETKNIIFDLNKIQSLVLNQLNFETKLINHLLQSDLYSVEHIFMSWDFVEKKDLLINDLEDFLWELEKDKKYYKKYLSYSLFLCLCLDKTNQALNYLLDSSNNINFQQIKLKIFQRGNWFGNIDEIFMRIQNLQKAVGEVFIEFYDLKELDIIQKIQSFGVDYIELKSIQITMEMDCWKNWSQENINNLSHYLNLEVKIKFSNNYEIKSFLENRLSVCQIQFDSKDFAKYITNIEILRDNTLDIITFFDKYGPYLQKLKHVKFCDNHGIYFQNFSEKQIAECCQKLEKLEIKNFSYSSFFILKFCSNLKKLKINNFNYDKKLIISDMQFIANESMFPFKNLTEFGITCEMEFEQSVLSIIKCFKQLENLSIQFTNPCYSSLSLQNYNILNQLKYLNKFSLSLCVTSLYFNNQYINWEHSNQKFLEEIVQKQYVSHVQDVYFDAQKLIF